MRRVLGVLMAVAMVLGGAVATGIGPVPAAHADEIGGPGGTDGDGAPGDDGSGQGDGEPGAGDDSGSGDDGAGEPGTGEPGTGEPGDEDPGDEDPGTEDPGTEEPPAPEITVGAVTIGGTAAVGRTLQATASGWGPEGVALEYRWLRDGAVIPNAVQSTYRLTASDRGKRISVVVTATLDGAETREVASARTSAVASGTLSASTPKISGTVVVGKTLSLSRGAWTSGTAFTYQWKRNGKSITGATKTSYKLQSADAGAKITVSVTGRLSGYTTVTKTSKATSSVLRTLTATPAPTIGGTVRVGSTLTAKPGAWKPAPVKFAYRWYRDGKPISGATRSTYRLTSADAGKKVSVQVHGTKSGYVPVSKASASKYVPKVLKAATPKISGSADVGRTLSASRGTWTSGTSFTYQWKRNGASITGATKTSYKLTAADLGKRITVTVKGTKKGYASETRTSAATRAVTYPNRTSPTWSGECPAWAPIKGNANSGIYHVPGGQYYSRTKAEECFRTEAAARQAGYRRSLR